MEPTEQTDLAAAEQPTPRRADAGRERTDDLVEDELLVEEISIDGMCGVY